MSTALFTGKLVRLAAADPDKHAALFLEWSRDSQYTRLLDFPPARQWSAKQTREEMERMDARDNLINLLIHTLDEDRPIGFVELDGIQWAHGDAFVGIGIGSRAHWSKGYGSDALRILMRYAFAELGLFRLSLDVFEYNTRAVRCYEKCGFVVEGRCRQWLLRDGKRWDVLYMGILRSEWEKQNHEP